MAWIRWKESSGHLISTRKSFSSIDGARFGRDGAVAEWFEELVIHLFSSSSSSSLLDLVGNNKISLGTSLGCLVSASRRFLPGIRFDTDSCGLDRATFIVGGGSGHTLFVVRFDP
jgi:hypothetical protein